MSQEVMRLAQAINQFEARTRGAELPKGVSDAVGGLKKALGEPMPGSDSPGSRAALELTQGGTKGTGMPMEQAAKGPDVASPGQRAAKGLTVSEEIQQAAESIAAAAK